jgi:hypothetical protein
MQCELCKDLSCFDQEQGRIMVHNNGKDISYEESLTSVAGCIIRQRHEQKELLKHLHKSEKRQNLIP